MTASMQFQRENALIDDISDECVEARAVIAAQEARIARRLARAWQLAQEQTERIPSADSRRRDMPLRCIATQISTQMRVSDRTLQSQMYDAWRLVTRFPATLAALEEGRVTKGHADAIRQAGDVIEDDTTRGVFEDVVLEWASSETVGRTRAYVRLLAEKYDPRPLAQRHADAAHDVAIDIVDLEHGMSEMRIRMESIHAHAIMNRLTQQAVAIERTEAAARRDARRAGPAAVDADASGVAPRRTRDQIRVDLFADLLLTGAPVIDPTLDRSPGGLGAIRANVDITMQVTTLTGVSQGGAELDGRTPVDPDTARRLAGDQQVWNRVMLDPVTCTVVAVDRYTPTPAQIRFIRRRDRHCRAPGCRMPAVRCQIDHNHERHDGGPTHLCNLACFCVRHHTMKTETEWSVRQLENGRLEFTSPSGRVSVNDPPPRVMFTIDEPPPF